MEENNKFKVSSNDIKTIHTYTSDMAEAVRENETSVIKIALAEKRKREDEEIYKEASGTTVSKTFLVIGGVIIIIAAIAALYFIIKKNSEKTVEPQKIVEIVTPIPYNEKVFIDVDNITSQIELSNSIKREALIKNKAGTIKSIFLKQTINSIPTLLDLNKFLQLMNTTAPSALIRSIEDPYMIGTFTSAANNSSKNSLFIIFKIKDYNQAYASMLTWEKTMLYDLFVLFSVDVSGERSGLLEKPWADIIINNRDARILYDKSGEDILYYMFSDKNTLIITDEVNTLKEVIIRMINRTANSL